MSILNTMITGANKLTGSSPDFWLYILSLSNQTYIHRNVKVKNGKVDMSTMVEISRVAGSSFFGFNKSGKYAMIGKDGWPLLYRYVPGNPLGTSFTLQNGGLTASSMSVSPTGDLIAIGNSKPNYLYISRWSDVTGPSAGFSGHWMYNPDAAVSVVKFSPTGGQLLVGTLGSPTCSLHAYSVSATGEITGKYADPSSPINFYVESIEFSKSGNIVVVRGAANVGTPTVAAYAWSPSGFGARLTVPPAFVSDSFTSGGGRISFNAGGDRILVPSSTSPFIRHYTWSNSSGFLLPQSLPGGMTAAPTVDMVISPGNDYVIRGLQTGRGGIEIYRWSESSGFGSKVSQDSTLSSLDSIVAFHTHAL